MPNVFISYSRLDESNAARLYADLIEVGLEVWFDKESLLPGQEWQVEIEKAIRKSDFVALLLSNNSVERRGYFQKEMRTTLDVLQTIPVGHIYLLPIRLEQCNVPDPLASLHYVDLYPDWDRGFGSLIKAIEVQSGIQGQARVAETQARANPTKILLVNDQPATMNLVVDVWKNQGFTVDYAFNVTQATKLIRESPPTAVVADLSQYSFDKLITDRAGFQILEWANANDIDVKVIITTSQLTDERQGEAARLGAVGICNNISDLNILLGKAIGKPIHLPDELATLLRSEKPADHVSTSGGTQLQPTVFILANVKDQEFADRLAEDLGNNGMTIWQEEPAISVGATFHAHHKPLPENIDIVVVVYSRGSDRVWDVLASEYEPIWGSPTRKPAFDVVMVLIQSEATEAIPAFLERETSIDFTQDYEDSFVLLRDHIRGVSARRSKAGTLHPFAGPDEGADGPPEAGASRAG